MVAVLAVLVRTLITTNTKKNKSNDDINDTYSNQTKSQRVRCNTKELYELYLNLFRTAQQSILYYIQVI